MVVMNTFLSTTDSMTLYSLLCKHGIIPHYGRYHFSACLCPMGFAIGLGFLTCEDIGLAVFFLTMQAIFASANAAGEGVVTRADIAPR